MTGNQLLPQTLTLSAERVVRIVAEHYGLCAYGLKSFDSELSSVFRFDVADGRRFAFKAVPYAPEELRITQWRTGAMERLCALGLPAGRTLRTNDGHAVVVADTERGHVVVHVGEWLGGTPLESVDPSRGIMNAVGRTAASVVSGLESWPVPPAPIAHTWELTRTIETLADTSVSVTDQRIRGLLERAGERFLRGASGVLPELPHSVVHHDLHDSNLLIDPERGEVSGVLDFGDMVWGPRIAELAVAAAYAGRAAADPVEAFLRVAEGWGRIVPLERDEVGVLLDAAIGRLAVNLSVWTARSGGERGGYAAARSARSIHALTALLTANEEQVRARLREYLGE